MALDRKTKIQRSVDSLERLFSVVVGLAITVAVYKVLFDSNGNLHLWYDSTTKSYPFINVIKDRLPAMLAFIVSIVPFYHGMNRHLDRTYVENDVPIAKEGFLVIDFFVFFLESCILVSFASLVGAGDSVFIVLTVLLAIDAVWAFATHGIHYGKITPSTITWGWINTVAVIILLLFYYSQLFQSGATRNWALCGVAIVRTLADYKFCWKFYFPADE